MNRLLATAISVSCVLAGCAVLSTSESPSAMNSLHRCSLTFLGAEREYFVQLPRDYSPKKHYWLLVTVHGGGGNGQSHFLAKGVRHAVAEAGLEAIVVSPNFSNTDSQASRLPALGEGAFLRAVIDDLHTRHRLHPKILLTGYSRGGQFSHRFALQHPDYVKAVAPFAAGTWTTPDGKVLVEGYGEVASPAAFFNDPTHAALVPERLKGMFTPRVAGVAGMPARPEAKHVPFLVMCGSLDTRFGIAQQFAKSLGDAGYTVKTVWPRTPHGSRDKEEFKAEFERYAQEAVAFFRQTITD